MVAGGAVVRACEGVDGVEGTDVEEMQRAGCTERREEEGEGLVRAVGDLDNTPTEPTEPPRWPQVAVEARL